MSNGRDDADFERRAHDLVGESVTRVDAHVRSRLTAARHAALAEVSRTSGMPGWLRLLAPAPALGAAAAAAVFALILWSGRPGDRLPVNESAAPAFDDIELIADGEALELLEEWDGGFYEWAAAQAQESASRG